MGVFRWARTFVFRPLREEKAHGERNYFLRFNTPDTGLKNLGYRSGFNEFVVNAPWEIARGPFHRLSLGMFSARVFFFFPSAEVMARNGHFIVGRGKISKVSEDLLGKNHGIIFTINYTVSFIHARFPSFLLFFISIMEPGERSLSDVEQKPGGGGVNGIIKLPTNAFKPGVLSVHPETFRA